MPPYTKVGLPGRSKRLRLELRPLQIFGNIVSTSEEPRESQRCPQLPQTFPAHKNDASLILPEPQAIMWRKWRGHMPGTSQFLGQCEQDTAHVGVVVNWGQWNMCSRGLRGTESGLPSVAFLLGERAAHEGPPTRVPAWPGLECCAFASRSWLLFLSSVMISSVFCFPPWGPCSRTFPGYPTRTGPLTLLSFSCT